MDKFCVVLEILSGVNVVRTLYPVRSNCSTKYSLLMEAMGANMFFYEDTPLKLPCSSISEECINWLE
jgi:hypothetical protein